MILYRRSFIMQKDKEPKKKIKVIPLNKPFAMDLERAKAERLKRE